MNFKTIVLATALTLPASLVMAQSGTGNAVAAASENSATTGSDRGPTSNGVVGNDTGSAKMPAMPPTGASEQGAPTAAAPNGPGSGTEPETVQKGKSR